jgi:hypothetical protein
MVRFQLVDAMSWIDMRQLWPWTKNGAKTKNVLPGVE